MFGTKKTKINWKKFGQMYRELGEYKVVKKRGEYEIRKKCQNTHYWGTISIGLQECIILGDLRGKTNFDMNQHISLSLAECKILIAGYRYKEIVRRRNQSTRKRKAHWSHP